MCDLAMDFFSWGVVMASEDNDRAGGRQDAQDRWSQEREGLGIEKPSNKEKGKVMKQRMPQVRGKADGKLVDQVSGSIWRRADRKNADLLR